VGSKESQEVEVDELIHQFNDLVMNNENKIDKEDVPGEENAAALH